MRDWRRIYADNGRSESYIIVAASPDATKVSFERFQSKRVKIINLTKRRISQTSFDLPVFDL